MSKPNAHITKDTVYTALSQIPAHVFGIIAGVFIARVLGPEGRGEYALYFTIMTLICTVFGASVQTSIIYFISTRKMEIAKVNTLSIYTIILTSLFSLCFVYILGNPTIRSYIAPHLPWDVKYAKLLFTGIVLTQVNVAFTAFFQGLQKFREVNKILILNGFMSLLGFGYLYIISIRGTFIDLPSILLMYNLILLMNTTYWIFYFIKEKTYQLKFKITLTEFKHFYFFTGVNHLSEVGKFFNHKAIIWITAFYLTTSELGIFSIGLGVTSLLMLFSSPIAQVLETYLNRSNNSVRKIIFARFSRIQFTFFLMICFLSVLTFPTLIPLVYGKEFTANFWVILILISGVLFGAQSNLLTSYFISSNQLKINLIATSASVITLITVGFLLIPQYGILGAAITQTSSFIIHFMTLQIILKHKEDFPYKLHLMLPSDITFIKNRFGINSKKE